VVQSWTDDEVDHTVTTAGPLGNHRTKHTSCLASYHGFLFAESSCFFNLSAKQQFVAVADYYGTLHILEIPWTLSRPSTNEVSNFWLWIFLWSNIAEAYLKSVFKMATFLLYKITRVLCSQKWEDTRIIGPYNPSCLGSRDQEVNYFWGPDLR
jgi:hypothetical protein